MKSSAFTLETRYASHPEDVSAYDTLRLRSHFHHPPLMQAGKGVLVYTHYDRFVFGGICPEQEPLVLPAFGELKSEYFLQRREAGILNVGGKGKVQVDGVDYILDHRELLYAGKGSRELIFHSEDPAQPARFYINSAPAHQSFPTVKAGLKDANRVDLGSKQNCNERTIYQFIHENGIQSCQLVMGFTQMAPGSIWNTFPPHVHDRRMEVYFYFDLPQDQVVMHFMGKPQETRHLVVRNEEAVISPPWSVHAGAGSTNYQFVWGMAGENKAFTDMDAAPLNTLL